MRKKHLFTSFALITALSVQMLAPTMGQPAMATTKMKLNKTSASIKVGKKVTLKVVGCKKSVSWSTNNKIVVSVKKSSKNSAVVTGKNIGTAKVTAKVKGKKFTCTVKVSKKKYTGAAPTFDPSTIYQGWTPTTPDTTGLTSDANTSATLDPNPTVMPGGGFDPSALTTTNGAITTDRTFKFRPIDTSRPAKLDAKFFLSEFQEGLENAQFVYVNVCNNMTEDILIEPEAYIQTDGICYPALNFACLGEGMDYIQVIKGKPKTSVNEVSETEEPKEEPENEVSETEAPKEDTENEVLETEEPKEETWNEVSETEEPKEETWNEVLETEEPKEETWSEVLEIEETKKDAERKKSKEYTGNEDTEEESAKEEEEMQSEVVTQIAYDAYDYVSGYYDAHGGAGYFWLPSNKNSIFMFYIRVANKRYMTVVNYNKEDAKFYKADSSDLLFEIEGGENNTEATSTPKVTETLKPTNAPEATTEPEEIGEPRETTDPQPTKMPGTELETDAPEETGEPDVPSEPEDPWNWDKTPEPEYSWDWDVTPKPLQFT